MDSRIIKFQITFNQSYIQILHAFYQSLYDQDTLAQKALSRLILTSLHAYGKFWTYYNYLIKNQYNLFSKMQYFKVTRNFTVRNFRLFLYKNSVILFRDRIVQMLTRRKKYKKAVDKSIRLGLDFGNFQFSWHSIALCSLRVRNINRKFFFYRSRFRRKLSLERPLFINLYNQKFLSKYSDFTYNWYLKHDIPFNIYYEHINSVRKSDISAFLNKFIGMFIFSGKKQYALKLTMLFRIYARKANLNFYQLFRHFLFHYIPFVYLKILVVKRRRITRPTLLSKEKAFFLVIKWWKEAAILRKGNSLAFNLFAELLEIFANKGSVVQKFRNLLVTAFNARSDLKNIVRRPYDRDKHFLWGARYRKFLNRFMHNTIVSNHKWTRTFLWRRRVVSSYIVRRFLLKNAKRGKKRKPLKFISNESGFFIKVKEEPKSKFVATPPRNKGIGSISTSKFKPTVGVKLRTRKERIFLVKPSQNLQLKKFE